MGSRAIAVSPDGKHVYVASSGSDAIAIFTRDRQTGVLTQAKRTAGCIAAKGAGGCAVAIGLDGTELGRDQPQRPQRLRDLARRQLDHRLRPQPEDGGAAPAAAAARRLHLRARRCPAAPPASALLAPDVVVVSPDGNNLYVGSFFGNSVAAFTRNPSNGALAQLSGTAACIAEETAGCATGIALKSVEGLAISGDGATVYAATALSNAAVTLQRNPTTGALAQASDGSGCIVDSALAGCTLGRELAGANAVAVSPDDDDVYVTSLFANSVTSFSRAASGGLAQKEGTAGCLIYLRSAGCSFGRALVAPEGMAVAPGGKNVYVAAFKTGAIAVLDRGETGAVAQKPGAAGCLATRLPGCTAARALKGVSSIALSPDGHYLYSTSFNSDAVDVFRRNK